MSTLPELRSLSSAELKSRIPSLERTAAGPKTNNAHSQAQSEINRITKILNERAAAAAQLESARSAADAEWAKVGELEVALADAREAARASENIAQRLQREASGVGA